MARWMWKNGFGGKHLASVKWLGVDGKKTSMMGRIGRIGRLGLKVGQNHMGMGIHGNC